MLDISGDQPKWDLADVMGDVPPARWRHTATLLPDGQNVLVFGGLNKGKRFNDTYVLSIDKMEWNIKECAGTPPHPRSHHTANLVEFVPEDELELPKQRIVVVGGYGGPGTSRDYFMDVNLLELDTWSWNKIANVRGPQPKPRSDHCACLTRGLLIISGGRGWSTGKTDPGFYSDMHVLDLKKSAHSPSRISSLPQRDAFSTVFFSSPQPGPRLILRCPPSSDHPSCRFLSALFRSGVDHARRLQSGG